MTDYGYKIFDKPVNEYMPEAVEGILACADSYLKNSDRLIYSYGSKTFLSGYDLFDPEFESRGNIDCSTFVLLVLAGIPYEESPYGTGRVQPPHGEAPFWAEPDLIDFSKLPEKHIGIAQMIGRPYLEGPKGLNLKKAEELGISVKVLAEEIRASGIERRSVTIAKYYLAKEACFSDASCIMPGDLVFFRTKGFFKEGDRIYKADAEINHVGIVAKDRSMMINSSGSHIKDGGGTSKVKAVSIDPLFGKRTLAFFARPGFSK